MTTANDLIVVFVALEALSIPLYVLAAYDRNRAPLARGRHEVLRARRVLLRGVPLRHRARLRRDRHHLARRGSPHSSRTCRCVGQRHAAGRPHAPAGRPRLQDRARSRSTCGRRTSTRDHRPRSPRSCPRPRRPPGSRRSCGSCSPRSTATPTDWRPAIWALAILTLLVGSFVALVQTDIKRMLAYSSISHAGYVLIGIEAGDEAGAAGRALLPLRLHVHDDRVASRSWR